MTLNDQEIIFVLATGWMGFLLMTVMWFMDFVRLSAKCGRLSTMLHDQERLTSRWRELLEQVLKKAKDRRFTPEQAKDILDKMDTISRGEP
jgi:hypothetical protein